MLTTVIAEFVNIALADLLIDVENPRLVNVQQSQQEAVLEMARHQGDALIRLAADIVDRGLDPTTLPAVVATAGDARKRYKVLEGNRRIVALRALETPALIAPVLSAGSNRRLAELAKKYAQNPFDPVPCVLFTTEADAEHWIRLRHTGQNQGVGLVEWGADEQDRWHARHAGSRRPAGQVLEFVDKHGSLSDEAKRSRQRVITNVERLLDTPYARQKLGIDLQEKRVHALYPAEQVARVLTHVVEDLKMRRIGVPELYKVEDRKRYVDELDPSVLPDTSKKLPTQCCSTT